MADDKRMRGGRSYFATKHGITRQQARDLLGNDRNINAAAEKPGKRH